MLAHSFGGFSPRLIGPLLWAYGEAAHHGEEHMAKQIVHLMARMEKVRKS
jgi:hypothetical protein